MTRFVVFDPTTGAIRRAGNCPAHAVALQAGSGEDVLVHDVDGDLAGGGWAVDTTTSPPALVRVEG